MSINLIVVELLRIGSKWLLLARLKTLFKVLKSGKEKERTRDNQQQKNAAY